MKHASAHENRFQEEYADSDKGTPQFEPLKEYTASAADRKLSQKFDKLNEMPDEEEKESASKIRSDLLVPEQTTKTTTEQTDSDLDDED